MPTAKGRKVSEVALKDTDLSAGEASSRAAVLKRLRTNDMVFRLLTRSAALTVLVKAGGIGPFAGGYGFGVRSTLLGYFLRFDAGWEMNTFFQQKPVLNVSMGVDF